MDKVKNTCDAISLVTALSALAGILPAIASLLSIIWYLVRLWDRFHGKKGGD